ncbi:MAG: tRNA (guanine(10)-N(2))-dimethyltransferase [Candidatus Aenigmarchaeota archaeon]|nr:tRNA (guanine(10)-N(2))-dimethyltransferase [Candidatus Aenigmarchaeota archaeon]
MIQEGKAKIVGELPHQISRKLEVFYNPVMAHNRDIAVSIINAWGKKIQAADPLAASGVRTIRLLKECKNVKFVAANDCNKNAFAAMKKNFKQNKVSKSKFSLHNNDASMFLLESCGFDYVDIDPFGSPNPFLDSAVKRLAREGILAVTATDTAALAGTSPKACMRKYWGVPLKSASMHEIGLRILIRKIQLVGAQYEKALVPIFSYAAQHYMRVYLQNTKAKTAVDDILIQHWDLGYCDHCMKTVPVFTNKCVCKRDYVLAGPAWIGSLWDDKFVKKMKSWCKTCSSLIATIKKESAVGVIGIIGLDEVASRAKLSLPPKEFIIAAIKKKGYKVAPTHFSGSALKTDAPVKEIVNVMAFHH